MGASVSTDSNNHTTTKTDDNMKKDDETNKTLPVKEVLSTKFIDFCSFDRMERVRLVHGTVQDRHSPRVFVTSQNQTIVNTTIQSVYQMNKFDEFIAILCLAIGPPNGLFVIPILTTLIGYFLLDQHIGLAFKYLFLYILVPLTILPQQYVPSSLTSYMSQLIIQYFSFRYIWNEEDEYMNETITNSKNATTSERVRPVRPRILVAPPHGVFPYGNILALLTWPCVYGYPFRGLAANSALRVPIFKQILKSIGVIDASRESAQRALENYPYTIGISTGGVAEVFETNNYHECIILRERIGLIKLAIRTGADLVPSYLFGNTQLLSCWSGQGLPEHYGRNVLEKISRKVGFALILIYGRWFLPIPYRVPVLGVTGKPVPTFHLNKTQEPTPEQIKTIQDELIKSMQTVFDTHKHAYGWGDKELIIK